MAEPLFLIGAGFNYEARVMAYGEEYRYPLVGDLLQLCFDGSSLPEGKSVEDLFQEAIDRDDNGPTTKLADRLLEVDQYVLPSLHQREPIYREFFDRFWQSELLTFNYDGLIENLLMEAGRWCPQDGFGIQARVDPFAGWLPKPPPRLEKSQTKVVHLHGSLYLYASEFVIHDDLIQAREKAEFRWDPYSNLNLFTHYPRSNAAYGRCNPSERIIAPIPNKADHLKEPFITASYAIAKKLTRQTSNLVSIGYSFNPHDRVSYEPILRELRPDSRLTIISPDAESISNRLRQEFPQFRVVSKAVTFREWASQSCEF